MFIICDVDNCISDDHWRRKYIKWHQPRMRDRYHDYHSASMLDRAENLDILRHHRARNHKIIFLTAMPEEYEPLRTKWLKINNISYYFTIFRGNDCYLDSVELKRRMIWRLQELGLYAAECAAAYDDRRDVLAMYKGEFGLPAIHLQIHEQEKM